MSNRWQDERDEALNAIEACPAKQSAPKPSVEKSHRPTLRARDYAEVVVPSDYVPHYSVNVRNVTHDF
jgi:hypothetical protein